MLAVREWIAGLVGAGLSAKRARKAHQVLSQILQAAVDGGKLARNVAAGVKLPKVQRREMHFLDAVQVEQLADATDPQRDQLARAQSGVGGEPHQRGEPLRDSKFIPGYFKPAARAAGLPPTLRFYDLRHTAASLLIREGASVKAVQNQLGHATASITLDTYGHLFPDELDALAGRLEDLHDRALEASRTTDMWPHGGPGVVTLRESAGQ